MSDIIKAKLEYLIRVNSVEEEHFDKPNYDTLIKKCRKTKRLLNELLEIYEISALRLSNELKEITNA